MASLLGRDRKFARGFDAVFEGEGVRVILNPLIAPRANAHAERGGGSARRERVDWMLIVSQRHLEDNDERPHRSWCPSTSRGPGQANPTAGHHYYKAREAGRAIERVFLGANCCPMCFLKPTGPDDPPPFMEHRGNAP